MVMPPVRKNDLAEDDNAYPPKTLLPSAEA